MHDDLRACFVRLYRHVSGRGGADYAPKPGDAFTCECGRRFVYEVPKGSGGMPCWRAQKPS